MGSQETSSVSLSPGHLGLGVFQLGGWNGGEGQGCGSQSDTAPTSGKLSAIVQPWSPTWAVGLEVVQVEHLAQTLE